MLIKRLIVRFLTKNPFRVQKFEDIFRVHAGSPVEMPECLTGLLKKEIGEILIFPSVPISHNFPIKYRKIGKTPRFALTGVFKAPDRKLFSIAKGSIIGQLGMIYDAAKRTFIDESAKEWSQNLQKSVFANALRLPEKQKLEGVTLSFLTNGADGGFYHFIFESLVKIKMYQLFLNKADHLLFNGPITDWKLKWLIKAGISLSKVKWVENNSHFECSQLIFTNKLIEDQQINKWCIATLKEIFKVQHSAISTHKSQKIIWITRKGLGKREIMWESYVLARFPNMEMVNLSSLSADECIHIMRNATHVISAHGAGLSNIYLCEANTTVLEIYPTESYFQPCYQRLAEICNLKHEIIYLDFDNQDNKNTGLLALTNVIDQYTC